MTVSSETSKVQYTAGGATDTFAYPFKIYEDGDLTVYVDDTLQALTTNYTVTGAGSANGGNVVFVSTPTANQRITIRRVLEYVQETDYIPNDPFFAEDHEGVADRGVMLSQQLNDDLGRTVKIPESDPVGLTVELPAIADRKSRWLACDTDGSIIASETLAGSAAAIVSSYMTTVLPAADALAARDVLGVTAVSGASRERDNRVLESFLPAGTKMIFYQASAPTGWTTDAAVADTLIGITGGSQAYAVNAGQTAGTWTQPNHTHAFTGDGHTHGIAHTHEWFRFTGGKITWDSDGSTPKAAYSSPVDKTTTGIVSRVTSADSWVHQGSYYVKNNSDPSDSGTESGTTGNGATANTWRPYAAICIVATKD